MINFTNIRSVHLEISTRCNAACPECPRNFHGVDIIENYPLTDMSLEQAKKIFTESFLKQLNHILINGNYGDFITARDGLAIVEYFRETNPALQIEISTNASGRPNWWTRLGELGIKVHFRLDGLEDTHHLYRQYTDFNLIIDNAKKFIAAGGYAIWAMIPFKHNRHQIDQCRQLSQELGFKQFYVNDAGRDTGIVFTRDKKFSHVLGDYQPKPFETFDGLWETYTNYVNFPEITLNAEHPNRKIKCKAKESKQIYIAANGEVYPCCWLGFYPLDVSGIMGNPGNYQTKPLIKNHNALEHGLEETIQWFNRVEESWNLESVRAGKIYTCNETCGIK